VSDIAVRLLLITWGILGSYFIVRMTSSGRPQKHPQHPKRADKPTDEDLAKPGAVAVVLQRLNENYETAEQKREAGNLTAHRWQVGTTVAAWVYSLLTLIIVVATLRAASFKLFL
jgi:hypothetical protein